MQLKMIYKDLQNVNIKQPSVGRGGKEKSIERGQTEVKKKYKHANYQQ